MSLLRLVFAWLVMAALPLQGIAASSMLFCDQAAHSTVAQPSGHDHAAHGHGVAHDHASHSHGEGEGAEAGAQLSQPSDEVAQAGSTVDDPHACPICASCCNLVALSETPKLSVAAAAPMVPPFQGAARVLTRHAPTPDKPPRA